MAAVTHPPEWTTPQASFRSRDDWSLKWWVMFALILSVVFHMLLVVGFDTLGMSSLQPVPQKAVPERIRISEQLLKDQQAIQQIPETIAPGNAPDMKAFEPQLDDFDKMQELPMNQEIDLTPNVKEITNFIRANDPGWCAGLVKRRRYGEATGPRGSLRARSGGRDGQRAPRGALQTRF